VTIHAADLKVCDRRQFIGPDAPAWKWKAKPAPVVEFKSEWGAPYGNHEVVLRPGESVSVEVEATDLSVAYVDSPEGGRLLVDVDSENQLRLETNQPFVDTDGTLHFMENRRGIRGLCWKRHRVTLRAEGKPVHVLGLFTYDSR
jgi:hypothetical protein